MPLKNSLTLNRSKRLSMLSQRLLQLQQEPDSPDAIATLPQLKRTDLAPKTDSIAMEVTPINESIELIEHPLFTNGIFYMDIGLDLRALVPRNYPMPPCSIVSFLNWARRNRVTHNSPAYCTAHRWTVWIAFQRPAS